ncbi:hypothetical protein CDD80_1730 [Ophiocordyceps camponoti-rufipedis]|uniref:Uncharacterized protein n=1 Tax=Ophiocordyceps camponoti-rufipedis TaxID=2004952 RepID=A0A2C5XEJ6_9HYPO|nr:hypothetical protein CDD80_1730 [Ophiocordyceps camponoti-rufipedis]
MDRRRRFPTLLSRPESDLSQGNLPRSTLLETLSSTTAAATALASCCWRSSAGDDDGLEGFGHEGELGEVEAKLSQFERVSVFRRGELVVGGSQGAGFAWGGDESVVS